MRAEAENGSIRSGGWRPYYAEPPSRRLHYFAGGF